MALETVAAALFAVLVAGVVAFQLTLAAGAPLGAYAMGGGTPGVLPARLRIAAVAQAAILAILALVVLADAGIILPDLALAYPWAVWVAVAFSGVSVALNAITRSALERRLWLPVAIVLFATSLSVALG
jgi:hypothetical protein